MDEAQVQECTGAMISQLQSGIPDGQPVIVVGIREGGDVLGLRIADGLREAGVDVAGVGALDITLYRDDFGHRTHWPDVRDSDIPVAIDNSTIILVDDVLFTGRTVRAAMNALLDYGRPDRVVLAVLVDRHARQLPICADVVGARLDAERDILCQVQFREQGADSDQVLVSGAV